MKILQLTMMLSCLLIFGNCSKDANLTRDDFKASEIMEKFNKGKLIQDHGILINGNVDIVGTDKELIVFVNLEKEEKKMFVLQSLNLDASSKSRKKIKDAQILFLHRSLIIQAKEGTIKMLFSIDEELPEVIQNITFTQKLQGYGLSLQEDFELSYNTLDDFTKSKSIYNLFRVSKNLKDQAVTNRSETGPIIFALEVECACCVNNATTPNPCILIANNECDAGGPGSTSCSISSGDDSCKVSCASNATPCCWEHLSENEDDDDNPEAEN